MYIFQFVCLILDPMDVPIVFTMIYKVGILEGQKQKTIF